MRSLTRGHRPPGSKERAAGQSLVEFALVFPIFWIMVIGLIEFSFMFNAVLSVSFASRNAAVVAAEAASSATADCSILQSVENNIGVPASAKQISKVDIYWTDDNGVKVSGATTTYNRTGSLACTVNGVSFSVPYALSTNGYDDADRCSTRSGCGYDSVGRLHSSLDTIGVQITYFYPYHTPYGVALGSGITMVRASEMRMEPFQ